MVQIAGKYVPDRSVNLDNYLKTLQLPKELHDNYAAANISLEIVQEGNKCTVTMGNGVVYSFPMEEEYEEVILPGAISVSKKSDKGFSIATTFPDGRGTNTSVYEFTNKTLCVKSTFKGVTSERHFKRVQ